VHPEPGLQLDAFDVEALRDSKNRVVVVHDHAVPALVLGSTQRLELVDRSAASEAGVGVVRRRSGGGAVLVGPDDPIWLDLWLPRGDPLWQDDVLKAPWWVGEWWIRALTPLAPLGAPALSVHRGGARRTRWSDLVCFAGLGPGEVVSAPPAGRATAGKLVGLAQWRSREGALFHCCAYRHLVPGLVATLLSIDDEAKLTLSEELSDSTTDLSVYLNDPVSDRRRITASLLAALPDPQSWTVHRSA
jgi:lipoate---protein ligase